MKTKTKVELVTYEVMTDSKGQKWDVPVEVMKKPLKYLCRHFPNHDETTFERRCATNDDAP